MKIPLTQGKFAFIDDEDAAIVCGYKWYALKHCYTYYAMRAIRLPNGKWSTIAMHRFLFGLKAGDKKQIDHWDEDGLNNRRSNIRIATHSQNQLNKSSVWAVSGRRGVIKYKGGRWRAGVRRGGKFIHLGIFNTVEEASTSYQQFREKELLA